MSFRNTWHGLAFALLVTGCAEPELPVPAATTTPDAEAATSTDDRPNILLIVADDLGFTDLGSFGSEIPTPNLDRLALEGVRLTNLHAARACQQTRAMLMSGRGVSSVMESQPNRADGQRDNRLTTRVAALPELMQDAGYATFMSGKWDLGLTGDYRPATRGFDRSFAQLEASSSHFAEPFWSEPSWYEEDGVPIAYEDLPEDFYTTQTYTDKMLRFLAEHESGQPWFAFMPYTAPHWPLMLPDDWLDRHAGRYDEGYDVLREARSSRAAELGVIPEGASMSRFRPTAMRWDEVAEDQQQRYTRAQELYAGMVEYLDMSIGRVIDYLEQTGQLNNTVIMFTSDHGASPAEYGVNAGPAPANAAPPAALAAVRDNRLENFGRTGSFVDHGTGFGEAATAPLKFYKGFLAEGGLRAAAFIRYPDAVAEPRIDDTFLTFMDILPTFLEIAGSEHPGAGEYRGRDILPIVGESFWPYLTGAASTVHDDSDVSGWSAGSTGAIIRGDYKAINHGPPGAGMGMGAKRPWSLYDIAADPGETNDLSEEMPELVSELVAIWERDWR
ncbi:MAG: sulfatase-like hydrolase/transferase [Gammaproteobacteria bacterium]